MLQTPYSFHKNDLLLDIQMKYMNFFILTIGHLFLFLHQHSSPAEVLCHFLIGKWLYAPGF